MEENRLDLINIWPNALPAVWPSMVADAREVLRFTKPCVDMARMYNEIANGFLTLWQGMIDGEYKGFITTHVETTPWDADKNPYVPLISRELIIVHGFAQPDVPRDAMLDVLTHPRLMEYARQCGCTHISFYSIRDVKTESAWERRLSGLGIERSYTKFMIPLKGVD